MTPLPVDLAQQPALVASRWAVVWWADGVSRQETYFVDRALADAYAAAHHGIVVRLAALDRWPDQQAQT